MVLFFGILSHALLATLHLAAVALDITLFFLLVRWGYCKWPAVEVVQNFNTAGSPVVDSLLAVANRTGRLSASEVMLWLSALLGGARVLLAMIAHGLLAT